MLLKIPDISRLNEIEIVLSPAGEASLDRSIRAKHENGSPSARHFARRKRAHRPTPTEQPHRTDFWDAPPKPIKLAKSLKQVREEIDAAVVAMRALALTAKAEWLAFNGQATQEQVDAWNARYGKIYIPHFAELQPVTIVPFPKPTAPTNLIQSSGQFVRDFVPPDYVVDRIFQRRFCYSMTAKTGGGKTAAAMRLAAHVATGRPIGSIEVEKGTVIYAAGENPTDVQARWLGVTQEMEIDPDAVDVHFINGVVKISENAANIETEVTAKGLKPTLVIVDTVAAYFEGDDDNDNVQMGNYARLLRSMTKLPGGPCVLALAHPTKRAADDDLIPKGGGAFLNEVDGNVALRRNGQLIAFEALGKFRGPSFEPVHFELVAVQHPKLRDTKGRSIPTIVARPVSDVGIMERERAAERDEDALLRAIDQHPRKSRRDIGKLLAMNDSRVYRLAQKLEQQKLIHSERSGWTLTATGQRELNAMDSRGSGVNQPPLPPARFPGAQ